MFKNKLNKYIFLEILKSYLLVLASLSLLIWIAQAAKNLTLVTEVGIAIKNYVYYIFFIFPKIVSQLMIISFLISLFLSLLKLLENKEIEIYWLSGIGKIKISYMIFKISFIPTAFAFLFYLYLVPFTNFKSRELISKSEFSMVNALVKKNNFNSPLKKLTIFVNKNDNRGNLEKIYIFEEFKTIISKKGRVLNINNKNYLELEDGFIHEKNDKNIITVVKFKKTIFDFTKYQTEVSKYTKLQEQNTKWLFDQYFKKNIKDSSILEEIHKRIFKPLFLPFLSILCCFLLFTNNEKVNLFKLKIIIFSISTFLIILLEIFINLSAKNILIKSILYLSPLFGCLILFFLLKQFLNREPFNK